MSFVGRLLLLAAVVLVWAYGQPDCAPAPNDLCARLAPGMVAFIGKQVSAETFDVQERLWGLRDERSVHIRFAAGSDLRIAGQLRFVAFTNGYHTLGSCDRGILILPVDDPWVMQFRRDAAARKPARAFVQVRARWSIPIAGAQVRLSGNGRVFEGKSGASGLDLRMVPPGRYDVAVTRANFTQPDGERQISILPGSCVPLRVNMISSSAVSGRIVDSRGEPVRHAYFHLTGSAHVSSPDDSMWDSAVERMRNWFERPSPKDYSASTSVRTGGDGRFRFADVYPGLYRLVSDISEVNEGARIPLPNTYYPGVYQWRQAKAIVVQEGRSVENLRFQLPDFGKKRRLEIQVLSEDGVPVAGAIVQNSGLDPRNERATNAVPRMTTDRQGRASFDLWPISEYRFGATLYLPKVSYQSDVLNVLTGTSDLRRSMVLKGLRVRR